MDFAAFKDQVRAAANIVEIVSEQVPSLKRVGTRYAGKCPFHTEKTPSFSVNPNMQIYKCFGCGVGGDVFKFVMESYHMTFVESVKWLAERYGVPIPKRTEASDEETRKREALYRMNELALRMFRSQLLGSNGSEARAYLKSRGVTGEIAEQFALGLSDRGGQTLTQALQREGFTQDQMETSGLVLKRQEGGGFFDRFRGRLMFPIHSDQGKVVGFGGRATVKGDEPKYLNSSETALYRKSDLLYNLNRARDTARKAGRIILVEGYMDVIGLCAGGITEVVASCGTALTPQQVKMMRRIADTVVVNFDPDEAGSNAAERSLEVLLIEQVRVRILELNEDLDPDEYIRKFGKDRYLSLLEQAPNYYYWLADRAKRRFDSTTAEGRSQVLKLLLPKLNRIPDKIERAGVAGDLASYLGVERGVVLDSFKKAALDRREQPSKPVATPLKPAERIVLQALLYHPGVREKIVGGLAEVPALLQLQSGKLLVAIAQLFRRNPEFTYADLETHLEPAEAALLSEIVFADELHESEDEEAVLINAMSSLRTLLSGHRNSLLTTLRQQVHQAQQKGDMAEALRLLKELDVLQKSGAA